MELKPAWQHLGNKGFVAQIELRIGPVDLGATIGLPAKPLIGDEVHAFFVREPGILPLGGDKVNLFRPVGNTAVAQIVGAIIADRQGVFPLGALGTKRHTCLVAESEGVDLHLFMRIECHQRPYQ